MHMGGITHLSLRQVLHIAECYLQASHACVRPGFLLERRSRGTRVLRPEVMLVRLGHQPTNLYVLQTWATLTLVPEQAAYIYGEISHWCGLARRLEVGFCFRMCTHQTNEYYCPEMHPFGLDNCAHA